MGTKRFYEQQPRLAEAHAEVIESGRDGEKHFVVLDQTIFYPEGGGQPSDHGTIGGIAVTDVQKSGGTIRHFVASAIKLGPAELRLDWGRRFDHMQQHTAQHLLTAVAEDRYTWATTAFHLGAEICDVELNVPSLAAQKIAELEEAVAVEIRAARPVAARIVTQDEFAALRVRTRGLPEGHEGDVRLVEIADIDLNTCGGTHLSSTSEIESLKLLRAEPMRGGTRLYFVAGGRVRRLVAAHETRNARLREQLGAPDADLPDVLTAKLEQLRGAERKCRTLVEELATALAHAAASAPGPLADLHFEGRDLPFLQRLGRALIEDAPTKLVFLTSSTTTDHVFLVAVGERVDGDAAAIGRQVADLLGGRGGGSGRIYQGKVPSLARRADAVSLVVGARRDHP